MDYEYKTVGGPERGIRRRGCRTVADRVAAAMEDIIRDEAEDGWEYMRTDLVCVEERRGLFSRRQPVHCSVLVFRRPLPGRAHADVAAPAYPAAALPERLERENDLPVLGVGLGRRLPDEAPRAQAAPQAPAAPAPEERPRKGGRGLFLRRSPPRGR